MSQNSISSYLKSYWIYPVLLIHFLLLLSSASELSISYKEADLYFHHRNLMHFFGEILTSIFGRNDLALRITPILLIIISSYFNYFVSKKYLKYERDVFVSVMIFTLLAGVNSAGLTYNISAFLIFFTYLFLYFYLQKERYHNYYIYILIIMFASGSGFIVLFFALAMYGFSKKEHLLKITSTTLFVLSYVFYGFAIDGTPRSYLLDTFGMFAGVMTPFLFLYIIYAIYRLGIIGKKDIIWYISATSLGLGLLLSLRQQIDIIEFAPFLIVSIPIILRLFLNGYRVRLRQFRMRYKVLAFLIVFGLVSNGAMVLFNKYLFLIGNDYTQNFAYRNYFVKELSNELKKLNIHQLKCENDRLQLRLKFYDIKRDYDYILTTNPNYRNKIYSKRIVINYYGRDIIKYYLYR